MKLLILELRTKVLREFPSLLWLFGCIALLLFFSNPLNVFLNKFIVNPVISEFRNNLFNNVILLMLSLGVCAWLWNYGDKGFLRRVAVFVFGYYVLQLSDDYWKFQHSVLFPFLRNWDMITAALVLPVLSTLLPKHPAEERGGNGFIEDLAIETAEEDGFNRKEVAREIAKKISATQNTKAFAIGVLGEYGSGKTSFINLIKACLDKEFVEVADFNPWSAESTPHIQKDFFDLLAGKLYEFNPQISGLVLDYSRKLSRIDSSAERLVRQVGLAGKLFYKGSYRDDFDRINALLDESGKKIVITIDDLDRLYHDEVMEVLRLIRNTANFTNIFYLVAYERSYIEESIKSLNAKAGQSYLDKIIQLEIPLPKRESNDLLFLLEKLITPFVTGDHMDAYRSHIVESGFQNKFNFAFEKVFRQSRDVIKFVNNFKITYHLLGTEVMFESLFVLELLKFRFPLIYDRLFEHTDDFAWVSGSRSSHEEFYELLTYKEEKNDLLKIARTFREEKYYTESEIKLISGILNNLFFKFDRSKKAKNAIIYPMFFERYFRYRLSGNELSEKSYRTAFDGGPDSMRSFIEDCISRNILRPLAMRLFQEKPNNRESYELKIRSLFDIGPKYKRKENGRSFDLQALIDELWNVDDRHVRTYYKKEASLYVDFLESLFEQAPFPYLFHNEIIYHIKKGSQDIGLSKDRLTDFSVQYFNKHVQQAGLSQDAMYLAWWTRHEYTIDFPGRRGYVTEHWRFEDKLVPGLKDTLSNTNPYQFLKYSIQHEHREENMNTIWEAIRNFFGSPEDLRYFVEDHPILDQEIKIEYLAFYDACVSAGFDRFATFEFKTSLKPARNDYDKY